MAVDTKSPFAQQVAGEAESGYPKILATDDDGILKIKDIFRGMAYLGAVTAVTDTTNFTVGALAGKGNDFFVDYEAHVVWDAGGASAAPQGEHETVSDYVSSSGLFTIDKAYSASIAVGDYVLFVHEQFGLTKDLLQAMMGGPYTLADIMATLQAFLDFGRVQTLASPVTLDGTVQAIYSRDASARPFFFAGGFLSWDSGAWAGGESVTINVDVKADGSNWENMWTLTLAAAASPLSVAVPAHANSALLNIPMGFWVGENNGVRVTLEQTAEGAGYHVVSHNFVDGKPGG